MTMPIKCKISENHLTLDPHLGLSIKIHKSHFNPIFKGNITVLPGKLHMYMTTTMLATKFLEYFIKLTLQ